MELGEPGVQGAGLKDPGVGGESGKQRAEGGLEEEEPAGLQTPSLLVRHGLDPAH